jgi:predicted helicase
MVNPSLALRSIPAEAFEYKLGNRYALRACPSESALDWVIDKNRSWAKVDPNRAGAERYIVRLVGQVARVSVETGPVERGLG